MDGAFSLPKLGATGSVLYGGTLSATDYYGNPTIDLALFDAATNTRFVIALDATVLTGLALTSPVTVDGEPALALPLPTLSAWIENGTRPVLPALTLDATLLPGGVLRGSAALPALTAQGAALAGSVGASTDALALPALLLSAAMGARGAATLPALTLQGALLHGAVARGSPALPALRLVGAGYDAVANALRGGVLALGVPSLRGALVPGGVGRGAPSVGTLRVRATLVPGGVGVGALTLPFPTIGARLYTQPVLTSGTLALPLSLQGVLEALSWAATGVALVMNTKLTGVTTYGNFAFNSFGEFGALQLAAGADGIYALDATDDAGAPTAATVLFPISRQGDAGLMRVIAAYVAYRAAGPIELTLTADDADTYAYQLEETRGSGIYRNRVKAGRGGKGSYWQAGLQNLNGADFQIDRVELETIPLRRKTG